MRPEALTKSPEITEQRSDSHSLFFLDSSSAPPRLRGENDFLIWQLVDSAFPTGGFAHSAGLEAAWQHGEVRHREDLLSFMAASLNQAGRALLPLAAAAYDEPERVGEFDRFCDAFTTNHVANRASRLQGKTLLSAIERTFKIAAPGDVEIPFFHFAPVFGFGLRRLDLPRELALRMFLFQHLRGLLAAAVRLNIVGPMEAQVLQHQLAPRAEEIRRANEWLGVDDIAQTAPLLDLWQGAHDRLYSRLFQS